MVKTVYLVVDDDDMVLADGLIKSLEGANYKVISNRTVEVGQSVIQVATQTLADSRVPVVVCGTRRTIGSSPATRIIQAARRNNNSVLVVQMERDAHLDGVDFGTKVADYYESKELAISQLLSALDRHYQSLSAAPLSNEPPGAEPGLDEVTNEVDFDPSAVAEFRAAMRDEIVRKLPAALTHHEFLDRARLRVGGKLTRAGILLFGAKATALTPSATIQCRAYAGTTLASPREGVNLDGPLFQQITAARQFVADRVGGLEAPTPHSATAVVRYDLPMTAVREIIANAAVHRDYAVDDACVHVRLFVDRLEVLSPGNWIGRELVDGRQYSLSELGGFSRKRNFRLAEVLYWVRLVEGEGSGIFVADQDCRQNDLPTPTVCQENGFVTVTLWRRSRRAHRATPEMLPPPQVWFSGRSHELATLDAIVKEASKRNIPPVAIVTGVGGVGKTALALRWAHKIKEQFPDGQLYVSLGGFGEAGPTPPLNALRILLTGLGVPNSDMPADLESATVLYRRLVSGRRMLVILDDAADADQVRHLLPESVSAATVVTSRNSLDSLLVLGHGRLLPLETLSAEDAEAMFVERLDVVVSDDERPAVREIVEHCGGLPLALAIAAGVANARPTQPLRQLASEMSDPRHRLLMLDLGDSVGSIRRVFSRSFETLRPSAQLLLRVLGLLPYPSIDIYGSASLVGVPLSEVRLVVRDLLRAHLLTDAGGERLEWHSLLHAYVRELAKRLDGAERTNATKRLLEYYLRTAAAADAFLDSNWESVRRQETVPYVVERPLESYSDAMEWFVAELKNLLAAIELAMRHGFEEYAYRLYWSMTTFLYRHGDWPEWAEKGLVAVKAAERLGHQVACARSHRILATAYTRLSQYEKASYHYTRARDIFIELGDRVGEAHTELVLGRHFGWLDEPQEALRHAKRALLLYRQIGDRGWEARAMNDVAREYGRLGNVDEGFRYGTNALRLATEVGDRDAEASIHSVLGELSAQRGAIKDALNYYDSAATTRRQLGDYYGGAKASMQLAHYTLLDGRRDEARTILIQAMYDLSNVDHSEAVRLRAEILAKLKEV